MTSLPLWESGVRGWDGESAEVRGGWEDIGPGLAPVREEKEISVTSVMCH